MVLAHVKPANGEICDGMDPHRAGHVFLGRFSNLAGCKSSATSKGKEFIAYNASNTLCAGYSGLSDTCLPSD